MTTVFLKNPNKNDAQKKNLKGDYVWVLLDWAQRLINVNKNKTYPHSIKRKTMVYEDSTKKKIN